LNFVIFFQQITRRQVR